VQEVNDAWGGTFESAPGSFLEIAINEAKKEGRVVVHLTMYGIPVQDRSRELGEHDKF